jgi:hypothetical protein
MKQSYLKVELLLQIGDEMNREERQGRQVYRVFFALFAGLVVRPLVWH